MKGIFFDVDGVIVRECGVADFGYAALFKMLLDGSSEVDYADLESGSRYFELVAAVRPVIKGRHFFEKLRILFGVFKLSEQQIRDIDQQRCMEVVYAAQKWFLLNKVEQTDYVLEDTALLIAELQAEQSCCLLTLTANEVGYTRWLLARCNIAISNILAYSAAEPTIKNKSDMIQQFMRDHSFDEVFVIGDGPADIRAGKSVGGKTVGIYWSAENKDALAKESPDLLISGEEIGRIYGFIMGE